MHFLTTARILRVVYLAVIISKHFFISVSDFMQIIITIILKSSLNMNAFVNHENSMLLVLVNITVTGMWQQQCITNTAD
jgi:hypothetical protein